MRYLFLIIIFFSFSCGSFFQAEKLNYASVKVQSTKISDSSVYKMLAPYAENINAKMNTVIATLTKSIEKRQPNGSMGLLFVDAMRTMAAEKYGTSVDAAFINNGGLRIPSVPAGKVTVGKIYEVMPFDNLLVLQTVSGATLQSFLNLIAKRGGWPVSGISFEIINGNATNIKIGGKPIDLTSNYTIANSDYIANGGDDAIMLKILPQINKGLLLRDVFIEYFKRQGTITPIEEQRITEIKSPN